MESTRHNSLNASIARAGVVALLSAVFLTAFAAQTTAQEQRPRFGIDRLFGSKQPSPKPVGKTNSLIQRARELLIQSKVHARKGQFEQAIVVAKHAEKLVSVSEKTTPVKWPATEESPSNWIKRVELARRGQTATPSKVSGPSVQSLAQARPQPRQIRQSQTPSSGSNRVALDEVSTGVSVASSDILALPAPDPEFMRPRRIQPIRQRPSQRVVEASPASGEFSRINNQQVPNQPAVENLPSPNAPQGTPIAAVAADPAFDFSLPDGVSSEPKTEVSETESVQQAVHADQPASRNGSDLIPVSNQLPVETELPMTEGADDRPRMPPKPDQPPKPFNAADGGTWTEIPERASERFGDDRDPRVEHAIVQEPAHQPQPFDATQRSTSANSLPKPLVNPHLVQPTPLPIPDDLVGAAPRLHPLEPTLAAPAKPISQSSQFLDLNQTTSRSTFSQRNRFGSAQAPNPIATSQKSDSASNSIWTSALIHVVSTLVGFVLALLFLFRYGSHLGLTLRVEHVNGLPAQAEATNNAQNAHSQIDQVESDELSGVIPFRQPAAPVKKTAGAIDPPFPLRLVGANTYYEDERQAAEQAERDQEQAMIKHIFSQNLELHRQLRRG